MRIVMKISKQITRRKSTAIECITDPALYAVSRLRCMTTISADVQHAVQMNVNISLENLSSNRRFVYCVEKHLRLIPGARPLAKIRTMITVKYVEHLSSAQSQIK